MDILLERCCGLDVHKRSVVACVITPESQEPRRLRENLGELEEALRGLVGHHQRYLPARQLHHLEHLTWSIWRGRLRNWTQRWPGVCPLSPSSSTT